MIKGSTVIERAQRGDRTAFRELVEENKRNVYFLALDLSGNATDAEDITQEVFVRAFKSLDGFRGEALFASWLYRITYNCSLDAIRKKRLQTVPIDQMESTGAVEKSGSLTGETGNSAGTGLDRDAIQEDIKSGLGRLSQRERSVFVLRHYQELSIREIAELLEIAEGTVKSLLFRAIRRLQDHLAVYVTE